MTIEYAISAIILVDISRYLGLIFYHYAAISRFSAFIYLAIIAFIFIDIYYFDG